MQYKVPAVVHSSLNVATTALEHAEEFTGAAARSRLPSARQIKAATLKVVTAPPRFVANKWNKLTPVQKDNIVAGAVLATFAGVVGGAGVGIAAFAGWTIQANAERRQDHFNYIKDKLSTEQQKEGQSILDKEKSKDVFAIISDTQGGEYDEFLVKNGFSPVSYGK